MSSVKGLSDDMKILTIPDLLKRVEQEYEKRKKEASISQKANEEKLAAAIREEAELTKKIGKEQKIAERLQQDYFELESRTEKEAREKASKGVLREADVRSGKVSLKDFILKGKKDSEINSEVAEQTAKELEQGLKVIREKNLEILELEKSRAESKNMIRALLIQPGQFLLELLKYLKEFTEGEVGSFIEDMHGYRTELEEVNRKIQLTQGKSLTPGYTWDRLSLSEAYKLIFNPIIPLELIPKLKAELEKVKRAEKVSVSYYLRSKEIDIRPIGGVFDPQHKTIRSI